MMDWSKQHCGVHQATYEQMMELMPDMKEVVDSFPDDPTKFTWDVKVHMLMPGQFPCIPNWHYDNVPRVNNKQDFNLVRTDLFMWLYVSNPPLTEFRKGDKRWFIKEKTWTPFTQADEHRGTQSLQFCWRGFVRATPVEIMQANKGGKDPLRRHSQVYLDAANFSW